MAQNNGNVEFVPKVVHDVLEDIRRLLDIKDSSPVGWSLTIRDHKYGWVGHYPPNGRLQVHFKGGVHVDATFYLQHEAGKERKRLFWVQELKVWPWRSGMPCGPLNCHYDEDSSLHCTVQNNQATMTVVATGEESLDTASAALEPSHE